LGLTDSSDVEGRLAVGGSAQIYNSVGQNISNWTCPALVSAGIYENALVVGGKLVFASEVS
jgi:hypothetical protein